MIDQLLALFTQSPRIAILMSGQGSNAEAVLQNQKKYPNLQFITLCTDKKNSRAHELSQQYQLDYYCLEKSVTTPESRHEYFSTLTEYLHEQQIDALIYAGFMKIVPDFFLETFPGINVHPADLTIKDAVGKPKYIGMHAVKQAIEAGETYLASTAHVVSNEIDCGQPLMVSKYLNISKTKSCTDAHEQLKSHCEHLLLPRLLELMAQGKIMQEKLPYQWEENK
jgi:phosphoribosylglycinamide formyltransferase-1